MHADEANQAVKLGELIEHDRYVFDPLDHHGPTLYYAAVPIARLRGERTLATLTETTVRLVPAVTGTLAVVLLAVLAAPLGRWPALAAAAFMAVSPPAVYYSRYFVQETLLVTGALGALVCAHRWWRGGGPGWAVATGICAGLMQATKASAPLFLGAALAAWLICHRRDLSRQSFPTCRSAALALASALVVAALFYSSFGTNLGGVRDTAAAYVNAWTRVSGESGHEKPWWYYLHLFGWQRNGGLVFEQMAFAGLACAGLVLALVTQRTFLRWAAVYTLIVAAALSLSPYKTPWHAVHFVPGLALLAAGVLATVGRWRLGAVVGAVLAGITLMSLSKQTRLTSFLRPADARNPYAYVHSAPDVLKFRALAAAAVARFPGQPVRVISGEYWPLPWYLRGLPDVGYWTTPPAECDGALLFVSSENAEAVRARLQGAYRESILGLRPGYLLLVFSRQ